MLRIKTRAFSHLFFISILLITFLHSKTVDAGNLNCEANEFIEIIASDDKMLGNICTAADKAIKFLSRYDCTQNIQLRLRLSIGPSTLMSILLSAAMTAKWM